MGKAFTAYTDQELISMVHSGKEEAFRTLVERYQGLVGATVIGMLGKGPEAEDVAQETFIRFFRSMKKFRGESGLGTYLTRIAINLSLNALKKRQRQQLFQGDPLEKMPDRMNPESRAQHWDREELVQQALARISPEFRSVVVLRMLKGYSTRETAEILQLPQGTVLSRLARGMEKLRIILSAEHSINDLLS
ncbi:MAG: RNA polymerase sigma factor [Bacteroidota bacterium]